MKRKWSDEQLIEALQRIDWPPVDQLIQMVKDMNYSQVAKTLGVSDNAIRKHIRKHAPLVSAEQHD